MSVIVKKDNQITLMCKGADSTIYERLDPKCHDMQEYTTAHLNVSSTHLINVLCKDAKQVKTYK